MTEVSPHALVHTRTHLRVVVGTPGWKWAITMFFIRRLLPSSEEYQEALNLHSVVR